MQGGKGYQDCAARTDGKTQASCEYVHRRTACTAAGAVVPRPAAKLSTPCPAPPCLLVFRCCSV
jgi:hypothetical protein